MPVPNVARSLLTRSSFFVIPVLLLSLAGHADAQKQRAPKTTTSKTAKANAPRTARAKAKTSARTKTPRPRTTKVSLAVTRSPKAARKELGKTAATTAKAKTKTAAKAKTKTAKTKTAKTKTAKPKPKPLNQAQREQVAIERVLGRGETLVRSTPFNGDSANPITGLGPIEVMVRQKGAARGGRVRRFLRMFSPSAERVHLVMVDGNGNATKLNSRPNSPVYRLFHGIANVIPLRELAHDVINSKGVRNGLFTAILGGAATAWNPVGAVGIFRGGQLVLEGIKRRTATREAGFDATVKWAQRQGDKGHYPNLSNAYRHYTAAIQKTKAGTKPATLKNFAELLAGRGL